MMLFMLQGLQLLFLCESSVTRNVSSDCSARRQNTRRNCSFPDTGVFSAHTSIDINFVGSGQNKGYLSLFIVSTVDDVLEEV